MHIRKGKIMTDVYRKQTYRAVLILEWLNDPVGYKKGAFQSFYKRALTYCSEKEDLVKELKYIMGVGKLHGYSRSFLMKVFRGVKKRPRKEGETSRESYDFLPVPYHLKDLKMVQRMAKRGKKQLVPRRNPTLFSVLCNEKDPLEQNEKKGVYRVPITDNYTKEKSAYIGVTSTMIVKCMEDHKRDIELARLNTSLAMLAYSEDVSIDWKEVKQIKHVLDRKQPTMTESVEILRRSRKEKIVNDRITWEPPPAWEYVIANM